MYFPPQMQIHGDIKLLDEDKILPAPDWVKTEIWLGWFCRWWQMPGARLVMVAILPTRDLASVFAGLGCLFAGAHKFEGGFTWGDLAALQPGTPCFFTVNPNERHCEGKVVGINNLGGKAFVVIKVVKGPKKYLTNKTEIMVSKETFDNHRFSKECLPAAKGQEAMNKTLRLMDLLGLRPVPGWQWDAGAEACTVTNRARYKRSIESIRISTGDTGLAVPLKDLINPADMGDIHMAKLRLETTRRHVTDKFPTLILDGKEAFNHVRSGVSSTNILILLDRSEFTGEIRDMLLEWNNYSLEPIDGMVESLPDFISPEIELSALILPIS